MNNQIIAEASIDVNEAPRQAENAQQTADSAKSLAGTANNNINNINAPEYLSPLEKLQLKIQMDSFATNYVADKDIATSEGIDFTAYDAAYQAYLAYMTPLIADMTTYSPIVRATFNGMVTAVQAEQKHFNAATQAQYNQQINKAQTDISDGQTKYKALQSDAETMKSSVAGIADAADRAISSAGFASNTASEASKTASTASQAASSALASAMSAESSASSAVSTANSTASAFGPVKQSADSALIAASSAVAIASSTASGFGKVSQKADSAFSNAMSAESSASSAVSQALSAASDSKDAKQIAGAVSQSYKTLTDGSTMTIAELESGLAVKLTKSDLNGYATQDWSQNQIKITADGIKDTMSSIKSTVDGQTTSINDLQADSNGFKDQFTKVNDTIGKHTTDIGTLQADAKSLSSNFESLNTDNGTNKHDISELKQTATEVSSILETVKTQVQNSAVGTNLLTNTGDLSANWFLNGTVDTNQKPAVLYYPKITLTTAGATNLIANQQLNDGLLQPSTTYTASFYAKGTGTFIFYCYPSVGISVGGDNKTAIKLSSNFQLYTITFTTEHDISGNKNFLLRQDYVPENTDQNTVEAYVYGLKLEKGSLATDWCANPADNATVTAVSKISQTVDGMQTDISKKIEGKDLNGYATQDWTQNQIKLTSDGINGTISSIKGTVDSQTTSINDLKADSSSFKSQFTKVNNTLGKQTTDIGTLQASSKELSSNFSSLNTDNSTNKTNISNLSQTVDGIKTDISKKIEQKDLNGYATETWTNGQIKLTSDSIGEVLSKKIEKTDLNGYATEDWSQNQIKLTADGINGTISSIKGTVDSHTTSINTLQADSNGFKDQFTKVNDTLGKHTTDIGTLQSDAKSLSANFDSLSSDNKTNQHDIGQLQVSAKEFNSTLETVQTQVKNSAVGTNLLTNTSDLSANWSLNGTVDTSQKPAVLHYPTTSLTSGTNVIANQQLNDGLLKPSATYTASFYAKGTGTFIFYCYPSVSEGEHSDAHTNIKLTSNYKLYTITFTTFSTISGNKNFLLRQDSSPSATDQNTVEAYVYGLKLEKGSLATDWCPNPADNATVTALTQVKQTADSVQALATGNKGDLAKLQITAKGLQSTVSDKVSSDQLTQLSNQLTNKISDLSSSTSSKFTQTSNDINGLVKKGDVVNQFNIDAGGALLSTSGNSTKIVFSSPNIIFDTNNPVQIPNVNIPGTLTGKTIEAAKIIGNTKITGADIEAPIIHSPSGSFNLDGKTGDIIGASIHSSDGSWGITANGKISGASITSSMINISGDGSGPNFDAENVTPDTTTGIYSRYKYTNPNVGFDAHGLGRKMYKNGYLVINGDTFLNRTIGDWSADGGGKYVYDTMYEANVIKMRAYNYTGSNVQTDDPSKTQGTISSRLDIQPSAITMGPDWSVGNPNILIDGGGRLKVGTIATNGGHSMGTTDGRDLYFMKMNKDATNVDHSSISIHVKKLYQSSLLSLKTDIKPIDPNTALETINNTDFMSYHFKNDKSNEPISVSPILDDVNPIPKYNTPDIFKSANGDSRNDGNILGYTALAVKALYAKVQDLNSRLQKLEGAN